MSGWQVRRLVEANPLWGSNGIAFGPDERLYVAQYLAGQVSAVDLASGDVEVIVPPAAPVQAPDDLAFGPDGSMYITDLLPGRVWRRDRHGDWTLVADGLRMPNGIAFAGERLFVNEMIRDGRLLELFPAGGEPRVLTGGLAMGNAMQLGPDGYLYYPHMISAEVFRISPDGGDPELVAAGLHEPVAVRFDRGGALLVVSRGAAGLVTRVDHGGSGDRTIIDSGVVGLDNAAVDAENRLYVSSFASSGVLELHPDGRTREVVRPGLAGPYGVTVDLGGRVHAADHYGPSTLDGEGVVSRELLTFAHGIVADGDVLHLTSQFGQVRSHDPATGDTRVRAAGLDRPLGIAVRSDGVLVVAESGAGRIVTIDADDHVSPYAEGFDRPVDIAFDTEQRLYVSDEQRGTVSRLGTAEPLLDGLEAPQGMAVRGDRLFVVETGRQRLWSLSLTTGAARIELSGLAVGRPARTEPALFSHGMPGVPRPFAGLAVAADGALHLSANGEGTILRLHEEEPVQ
jgi:sugar lactone lactonase YvrE